MSDELGFALPKKNMDSIHRIYAYGTVVGLVLYIWGDPTAPPMVLIGCALLIFATLGVGYLVVVTRKIVFVSSDGIRGLDSSGRKTSVLWSDRVKVESAPYSYWPGLRVSKEDGAHVVFPISLTTNSEFQEKLRTCAPRGHALLEALTLAQRRQ